MRYPYGQYVKQQHSLVPTGPSGGQPGYAVGLGFDEVTDLGSLDVWNFMRYFMTGPTIKILTYPPGLTFGTRILGVAETTSG